MKNLILVLTVLLSAPSIFAQLPVTGNVMKIENTTNCDKWVNVREANISCGTIFTPYVVPANTTIAAFSSGPGYYFDAAQVADYSGSMGSPIAVGGFNVKIQGIWTICPTPYTSSASGASICAFTTTAQMVKLYPGSDNVYILIN